MYFTVDPYNQYNGPKIQNQFLDQGENHFFLVNINNYQIKNNNTDI